MKEQFTDTNVRSCLNVARVFEGDRGICADSLSDLQKYYLDVLNHISTIKKVIKDDTTTNCFVSNGKAYPLFYVINELPSLRAKLQDIANKHNLVLHLYSDYRIWAYVPETMTDIPENTMFGGDVTNIFCIMSYMYTDDIDYASPYIYPIKEIKE